MFLLPHPLSLSRREREYCCSLALRERAGVRAIHCSYPRKCVFLPPAVIPAVFKRESKAMPLNYADANPAYANWIPA